MIPGSWACCHGPTRSEILDVWTNADYPADAERAAEVRSQRDRTLPHGTHVLRLCRSSPDRATNDHGDPTETERLEALDELLPLQRSDFAGLFRAMDDKRVIIRLLDPPLHEFLPESSRTCPEVHRPQDPTHERRPTSTRSTCSCARSRKPEHILSRVEALHESNPMLGLRGVTARSPDARDSRDADPCHLRSSYRWYSMRASLPESGS